MKMFSKFAAGAAAPLLALTVIAASPADAQSRYRDHGRDRDNTAENALIGAAVGGIAGAIIGNGDGSYVAGGALAGAALGATASNRGSGCEYYRGNRCYRNQGHWEREHGIDRSDGYYGRREYRQDRRNYRNDRRW